jgi:endonuclease/exonuclease/phosphatase (EEP) superfamily protein YafD
MLQNGVTIHCILKTNAGRIDLYSIHIASPHLPLYAVLHDKPGGKAALEQNIIEREAQARELNHITQSAPGPILMAGDFNLCPDSPIFRENFPQFTDAYDFAGFGFGWTYRAPWVAMRIDHILSSSHWICRDCWLGTDVGSPHLPVIADFSLRSAQ